MTPTRPRTLLAVAIACALVAWLAIRTTFPNLPRLPWTPAPLLLVLAAAEAITGRNLQARILGRRDDGKALAPIAVARAVALAKASSLGGAVFAGLAAGSVIYTLGLVNLPIPASDALNAGLVLGAAIVLVAAALYLEYCCRAPSGRDRDDGPPSGPGR
jgi:Protein of unknown function (DUF3180)